MSSVIESPVPPLTLRLLHMGLAAFGVAAYLTAELAEEGGAGYLLHAYLGLSTLGVLVARLVAGTFGRAPVGFAGWAPWRRAQWTMAAADLAGLLRLRLPRRPLHQGLAGLVQTFGLCLFAWMAITGTMLFVLQGQGGSLLFEVVEESHEVGEGLIPVFLVLHVGAVLIHTLLGERLLKRMFRLRSGD